MNQSDHVNPTSGGLKTKDMPNVQYRLTLLLNHEIASVETAMRYNAKWAVVPRYYEEDRNEPGKYDDAFRVLRAAIFKQTDWRLVDPMMYLTPFLTLIKASDISGPITGAAAVALQRILGSELMTPGTHNATSAINQIVEDATQCKFESTNNAQDETVLLNIVQVLGMAVDCECGTLLHDDTVLKAFQATFMLGDPVTKPKEYGDIMGYYSRQTCGQMLRVVFTRLRNQARAHVDRSLGLKTTLERAFQSSDESAACNHGIKAALDILDFLIELIKKEPDATGPKEQNEETIMFALNMIHTALLTLGQELVHYDLLVAVVHVELLHAMCQAVVNFTSVSIINAFSQIMLCIYSFIGTVSISQIELVMERVLLRLAEGKAVTLEQQEAALEGVLDLCRQPGFVHDIFANCDCRLERGNLFEDLCALLSKTAYPMTKGALNSLHSISLEAMLAILQAVAAESKSNAFQPPPAYLELPSFVDVWTPLVGGGLLHLDGLIEVADKILGKASSEDKASAAGTASRLDQAQGATAPSVQSSGGIESAAEHAAAERALAAVVSATASASPTSTSVSTSAHMSAATESSLAPLSDYNRLRSAIYEKHMKRKLVVAVDHFNKDHKKGLQFLQASKLMPFLEGSPGAKMAQDSGAAGPQDIASQDQLAGCLGRFLHVCPGLDKVAIGELLGDPAQFYIKVLEAFTQSFDFRDLKFDAAIRLFLESFRLPGEAQKIDRIINAFGHHYFTQNKGIFKSEDAAYVLAYSVIMLNTDRHNSQVKNKMSLESFRRNLRGVNDNSDFPPEFLDEIYYSIVKTALKLNESSSMEVSEQVFLNLHQISCTPRGKMVHSDPGRHLFDTSMFRLMWGPAVHAMCSIVDNASSEAILNSALSGLQTAAHIAMCHDLEDVADSIVVNLSKVPGSVAHVQGAKAEVVYGRSYKMRAVTWTISSISLKYGDNLQAGWTNVVDLILCFYRMQMLPESFSKALNGDGDGGLSPVPGEQGPSLKARRAAAKAQSAPGASIFKSLTSMLTISETTDSVPLSEPERTLAAVTEEALTQSCFEDIFTDSKFLKQESLVHLVKAIIWASGPIPRPGASNGSSTGMGGNWDVTELCLELLFTVLLRNRDRISLLWPRIYEHFHSIFSHSKDVDPGLVQKAIMAMLRMCQRLLPYKTDISEPLMKGIQLVSKVDEQVASDMASTIAAEVLNLLKGAAPYIQHHPVWVSICGLLKIIQYDPASFPVCVETMAWVVKESLTPLNFTIVLTTVVDLLERAVPQKGASLGGRGGEQRQGHPQLLPELMGMLLAAEEWLELWWLGMSRGPRAGEEQWQTFKHEAWYQVVSMLCRVIKNPNLELRNAAVGYLQRSVVAAEKLTIGVEQMEQSLVNLLLPMTNDLSKMMMSGAKDFPQCDSTVRELIRAMVKVVLLFSEQLQQLSSFPEVWKAILECVGSAMATKSEVLTEAIPEALKNMLLVLKTGKLQEGWRDTDGTDLHEMTWTLAKNVSANLTPELLST